MIEFVQGDMFETPADIRINTVNCVGVMGAGVALAFKKRHPDMFKDYQRACKDGLVLPGKLHVWRSLAGDWVINFPTKRDWRDGSRYEDINDGLDALHKYLQPLGKVTVALPALGCGHGGLDWDRVSQMIKQKLSDLSANLLVFAPSDSRRAGRTATQASSEDELLAVEHLGYTRLHRPTDSEDFASELFVKGKLERIKQPWIALLPSREPAERETSALSSIATELLARGKDVTVALVYNNRTSEEVAQIFTNHGIDIVMLLPFGVLTRKTLPRVSHLKGAGSVTLISSVPPSSKWSRTILANTMNFLRARASTVLLSDPNLDWLAKRSDSKWNQIPTFFLRYETLPNDIRNTLSHANTSAIGRRQTDGAPNLDALLSAFQGELLASGTFKDTANAAGINPSPEPPQPQEQYKASSFSLNLKEFPVSRWSEVIALIQQTNPLSVSLEFKVDNEATAKTLKKDLSTIKANNKQH